MSHKTERKLGRWSRLKHVARTAKTEGTGEKSIGGAAPLAMAREKTDSTPAAAKGDAEQAAPGEQEGAETGTDSQAIENLPSVDSLGRDSDFTPFLAEGVPEELARAALRKLWRSDPVFADLDGLDDYDEDFSIIRTVAKAVQSHLSTAESKFPAADESKNNDDTTQAPAKEDISPDEHSTSEETAESPPDDDDGPASRGG